MQLLLQSTWDTNDPALLLQAQQWAFQLIDMFPECGSAIDFACPYDFTVGNGGWSQVVFPFSPNHLSHYSAGLGWVQDGFTVSTLPGHDFVYATCNLVMPPTLITSVKMFYDLAKGGFGYGADSETGIYLIRSGTVLSSNVIRSDLDPDGTGKSLAWTGSETVDTIQLTVCAENSSGGGFTGTARIFAAQVFGNGLPPC
jgi:hypothetical protein